jgi:probable rRNA maturation factor
MDAFSLRSKKNTMDVSLVFLTDAKMRKLNKTYRGKDAVTNVLAFPLDEHTGEICISPETAKREAKEYSMSVRMRVVQLFLHGLLHLEGHDHETDSNALAMERIEERMLKKLL